MIGYENQVKAFKNLDKNVIGELPVEKNSELFRQNIVERPDSISYDEFIKNYPVEELGPIPFWEGTGDTLTPDDWLREQIGTGYQLKEGVTPEEFRKSLDNFIEQIDNPHIKEGLLSRYRKYDKLSEGIIDQTVKSRILGAVNQDVFYDVIAFNDDLYTTKKTEDMAIVFDGWTEPTPIEDMALAEMEDWDWVLDEQGNKVEPIDPRKNIQGMDKYDKTLNQYYKYYTEEITDTPTNVVPDVETLNIDDYKPFTLEVTDPAGLHARPAAGLLNDLNNQGLKLILMEDGVLKEVGMTGLLKRGIPVGGTLELFVPKDLISIDMGDGSDGYKAQTRGTLRVMEDASVSVHSDRIRKIAQDYHKIMGYSDPQFKPAMIFNDEIGAIAADIFEQLPMFDDNAIPYYKKFIGETNMQYQVLLDSGIKFEIVDVDPYTPNKAGHQQMIADMENGTLKVLATESGFGNDATSKLNPMLAESRYQDVNGRVMLENDVFRAVHDTFGHGMRGNTFGPIGEYNAWLAHKEMYSPDARRIMTTETLGQNTYTNYGQHMRDVDGNLIKVGDPNYIKPADRPFAPQKVALMPEEIINVAGTVVEDASELVDTDSLNKLKELANAEPEIVDNIFKSAKKAVGKTFGTVAGVLDPGDVAITAGITRLLPRLGAAAIAPAALAAYVGYELAILAIDAGQAYNKAIEKQGGPNDFVPSFMGGKTIEGKEPTYIDYDWKQVGKDTWEEFGEVSDTWSLSWKISEPIIDYAFEQYGKLQESR